MKQDISVVRGTTNFFGITVTDTDGHQIQDRDGQKLIFAVKKNPKDNDPLIVKAMTVPINGEYWLDFTPADTADLEPGKYFYDVGMQYGSAFYNVIEASTFEIKPNISELGDAQ